MKRSSRLSSIVCLSGVRFRKVSEIGAKFYDLHMKSRSPTKNMTSDIARELAKYPKVAPNPKIAQNGFLDNEVSEPIVSLS